MSTIAVIGGGASGLMSAYAAAENNKVVLFEKNSKLGKKIYITGKGRCNVTNDCSTQDFLNNVVNNAKFLTGCINAFSPEDFMAFLEDNGLNLKVERGNRVFPASDKASDVTKCFERLLYYRNVELRLDTEVTSVLTNNGTVTGVATHKGIFPCDKVIVCTGGLTYPVTGSTGDGYCFAESVGHTVVLPKAALTGIELSEGEHVLFKGVSLKNVRATIYDGEKSVYSDFGEMLFTHFGVSGPIILSASSVINRMDLPRLVLSIDLKPALSEAELNNRLLREFALFGNKDFCNVLPNLVPRALINLIIARTGIMRYKKTNLITVAERKRLIHVLKHFDFKISKLRPMEESIITSGGVNVREINPKTMESKLIKGLFFAGEVLDVDAFTGGFNLQIAFSTGRAAGLAAGKEE